MGHHSRQTTTTKGQKSAWLVELSKPVLTIKPKIRLVGFPYAGGSASVFRDWPSLLGDEIQMLSVQLPGRGSRFSESPITDFSQLVNKLADALISIQMAMPTVFFGHSMGASLAFDVACELKSRGAQYPKLLILSGRAAPSRIKLEADIDSLTDEDMISNLHTMQGTPPEVLNNPEMLTLLMPTIRADYSLLKSWKERDLSCNSNILALAGRRDAQVKVDDVAQWQQHTSGRFEMLEYSGGHFFLHEQQKQVTDDISMSIRRLVTGT